MIFMRKNFIELTFWGGATLTFAQTLHNGITLPEQWPPRRPAPTVRKEMLVPYLDSKPTVIPINTGRQLFVDNFLVKETNLESVYHTPNYYAGNPVLEPDKEWEKTIQGALYAAPFSDGIWYDDKDGKYKMWYLAGAGSIHKDEKQTFYTCYAESTDGKHWEKVNQDIVPGTNIVDTCNRDAATVWLIVRKKILPKRWKFLI